MCLLSHCFLINVYKYKFFKLKVWKSKFISNCSSELQFVDLIQNAQNFRSLSINETIIIILAVVTLESSLGSNQG